MADEKRYVKFSEQVAGDELHVGIGNYTRSFSRAQEPFELSEDEWQRLQSQPYFELVAAPKPKPPKADAK